MIFGSQILALEYVLGKGSEAAIPLADLSGFVKAHADKATVQGQSPLNDVQFVSFLQSHLFLRDVGAAGAPRYRATFTGQQFLIYIKYALSPRLERKAALMARPSIQEFLRQGGERGAAKHGEKARQDARSDIVESFPQGDDLLLSEAELQLLTGYKRAADQLQELHKQGFYRARRGPVTGNIILERVHYEAVCGGLVDHRPERKERPVVKVPTVKPLTRAAR